MHKVDKRWKSEDRWENWIDRQALPDHHLNKSLLLLVFLTYQASWVWWSCFLWPSKVPSLGSTAQSLWCPKSPSFCWSIAWFMACSATLSFQNGTWLCFRSELPLSSRNLSPFAWRSWDRSSSRSSAHWLARPVCTCLHWTSAFFGWSGWKAASCPLSPFLPRLSAHTSWSLYFESCIYSLPLVSFPNSLLGLTSES